MNISHHLTSQLAAERQRDLVAGGAAKRAHAQDERGERPQRLLSRAVLAVGGVRGRAPVREARGAQRAGC